MDLHPGPIFGHYGLSADICTRWVQIKRVFQTARDIRDQASSDISTVPDLSVLRDHASISAIPTLFLNWHLSSTTPAPTLAG